MVLETELRRGAKQGDDLDSLSSFKPEPMSELRFDNCKKQIACLPKRCRGDHYVFAVYDCTARKRYIEPFIVPSRNGSEATGYGS